MNTLPDVPGTCTTRESLELIYGSYSGSEKKVSQLFLNKDDKFEYLGRSVKPRHSQIEYKGSMYAISNRQLKSAFQKGSIEFSEFIPVEVNNVNVQRPVAIDGSVGTPGVFRCPPHIPNELIARS